MIQMEEVFCQRRRSNHKNNSNLMINFYVKRKKSNLNNKIT